MLDLFSYQEGMGETLHVHVIPKASANKIKIVHRQDGTKQIRVYVTVAPEDGKANKEVIKLLAKNLGLPQSALTITRGLKSRDKTLHIV